MDMIATTKGNLGEVRAALAAVQVGDVVDIVDPGDPLAAQIVPGVSPAWHVLEVQPNHERSVAAHLIARRFGVFVPETEEDIIRRGRKLHVTRLMFRGYVFVFVWDILAHKTRLEVIPGVTRIMRHPPTPEGEPGEAVVLTDALIDRIRAVENSKRPMTIVIDNSLYVSKKKRRRWRKERRERYEKELKSAAEIVACRPWSAFEDALSMLDDAGRNQTLLSALGLSSQQPPS
ncbi:transcription termination/antitermination protein NusG [Bradyrhizobium sp. ORS 86]|uniref:transcription termination/antitermination protein NusG n=1 Tax=Bradyrhizobium sp. ORS 86 TaxID=1685970 RepID=UPI00388DE808